MPTFRQFFRRRVLLLRDKCAIISFVRRLRAPSAKIAYSVEESPSLVEGARLEIA